MRIAVVICTKDRPAALERTAASLWQQSRLPDELLIIDDGRLDEASRDLLSREAANRGVGFTYHQKQLPGLTRSRNEAAGLTSADVLVYLDDDVTCAENLLEEVAAIMSDERVAGLSPVVKEPALASRSGRLWQMGYRVAGWWSVGPLVDRAQRGPMPAVMAWSPERAGRLRWLSGAAMALRRDVVAAERFDETLTEYALGEDREMGYRLARRYWLVEAKKTYVVHRRETGGRGNPRRFGLMTARNYLTILSKTRPMRPGDWALAAWSLGCIGLMHAAWGLARRRAHWQELLGMAEGVLAYLRRRMGGADGWQSVGLGAARNGAAGSRAASDQGLCCRTKSYRAASDRVVSGRAASDRGEPDRAARQANAGGPGDGARRPLRVMFATNRLEPGGAEQMLVSLARRLGACGVEPVIGCLKDAGPLADAVRERGIAVHDRLLRHKGDLAVIGRLRRLLRQERIDVVTVAHSGGDRMFWSTLSAATCERPVVVWSHWFPRAGRRHFEAANRALYRMVDVYVALGERQRLAMIRHEQVPAGRIAVIPNAIELDAHLGVSRAAARKLLRLSDDQFAVGIVANLRVEKRHDVFIAAARALAARHRHMRFFIIGDGPQRDMVQSAAEASGLDHERLRLLGARHDVAALWPGLDAACLCSEVECFSVSMLEAAASGVAFVAPDVGCLGEFLEDGQTGLLTRPADPEGLTRALDRLATDSALRKRLVEQARRRVVHEYGIETMAAAFSDLYHEVVRRRVAGGGRSPRGVRPQNRRNERGLRPPADTGRPVVLGGSVGG